MKSIAWQLLSTQLGIMCKETRQFRLGVYPRIAGLPTCAANAPARSDGCFGAHGWMTPVGREAPFGVTTDS